MPVNATRGANATSGTESSGRKSSAGPAYAGPAGSTTSGDRISRNIGFLADLGDAAGYVFGVLPDLPNGLKTGVTDLKDQPTFDGSTPEQRFVRTVDAVSQKTDLQKAKKAAWIAAGVGFLFFHRKIQNAIGGVLALGWFFACAVAAATALRHASAVTDFAKKTFQSPPPPQAGAAAKNEATT